MKIVRTVHWEADDGTRFVCEEFCIAYERVNALSTFIMNNITYTYNDNAGFNIIEETDVESFINNYLPEITAIVNRQRGL